MVLVVCTLSNDVLYLYEVSWKYFNRFQDIKRTRFCDRPTNGKMDRHELRFLSSARHLMMLYISMKFHKNALNGFQVIYRTQNDHCQLFQRGITPKLYALQLLFLWSARRLVMLYISMNFHDTILNELQIIERTRNYHCQISKGNNSKNV